YVNKNQPPEDLLEAIKDVHYDLVSVPDEYKELIPETTNVKAIFTKRESEIMKLIAIGQTSELIAKQLQVSLRTIENIKLNLFKKMELTVLLTSSTPMNSDLTIPGQTISNRMMKRI
ncbi:transcriptional regulator, LuxR family, partial [Ostertagia ostertagi]